MLQTLTQLPAISCLLAAFGAYWILRGRRDPEASLEQRLDKLDLAVTSMRAVLLFFFLATLLLANLLVHSLSKATLWEVQLKSLKAEAIVLLGPGDEGPYRATLRTDGDAVRFNLQDKDGKKRITLAISAEGIPVVGVLDASEKPKGYLGLTEDQTFFWINDQNGKPGAGFTLGNDGTMTLGRFVGGNKPVVAMTFAQGMPILSLHDESGKGGVTLSMIASEKRNCLEFRDDKGVKRLEVGLANNVPVVNRFDEDGKPSPVKP